MIVEYITSLFNERLIIKRVYNRFVTARELQLFFTEYCKVFHNENFPHTDDLFTANANANNRIAKENALKKYREEMDEVRTSLRRLLELTGAQIAGTDKPFIAEAELRKHHKVCYEAVVEQFRLEADYGPEELFSKVEGDLQQELALMLKEYEVTNKAKYVNPQCIGAAT